MNRSSNYRASVVKKLKISQLPFIVLPCSDKVSILTGLHGFIIIWMISAIISFIFYLSSLYNFFSLFLLHFYFVAWVGSILVAVFMVSGPLVGGVINHFGCRVTAILGCLLCAAGLALSSLAKSIVILYLTFSIPCGIGICSMFMSCMVIVAKYFEKKRSAAVACVSAGAGIGTMVTSAIFQALLDSLGWKNTLRVMACVMLLLCILGCSFDPNVEHGSNDELPNQPDTQQDCKRRCLCIDWSVCKVPIVLVITASAAAASFSRVTPFVHLVSILVLNCYNMYP